MIDADGTAHAITWLPRQTVRARFNPADRLRPVMIKAGALGADLPDLDLCVTTDHAIVLDGMLVNAGALVNGDTIRQLTLAEMPVAITYYHIETAQHAAVIANGLPSESFVDYVPRRTFDNYDEYLSLGGDDRAIAEMPLPRIASARQLPTPLKPGGAKIAAA